MVSVDGDAGMVAADWSYDVSVQLMDDAGTDEVMDWPDEGEGDESWLGEATGRRGRHRRDRGAELVARGKEAVHAAVEALSAQIGAVTRDIADGLDKQGLARPPDGEFGLDAVELTFGVTLKAGTGKGIEAMLQAAGEATVQVKVSLTRLTS